VKARLVSVLASMTLSVAAFAATATPAYADPAPPEQQFYVSDQGLLQNPSNNTVNTAVVSLDAPNGHTPAGSYADVTFSSCGQVVQSRRHELPTYIPGKTAFMHNFSASGAADPMVNEFNRKIGQALDWTATIVHPGYDPYVISSSIAVTVKRPSCDVILAGGGGEILVLPTAITVSKWSAKKGVTTAKVGKTLKVTPTRAPGSKVTYAWKVGTKTVDWDRAMTVKKAYRGKKVTMRVTVSKTGEKSVSKTLRYGKGR
jgi:hypothetical protein